MIQTLILIICFLFFDGKFFITKCETNRRRETVEQENSDEGITINVDTIEATIIRRNNNINEATVTERLEIAENNFREHGVVQALDAFLNSESSGLLEEIAIMENLLTELQQEANWREVVAQQLNQSNSNLNQNHSNLLDEQQQTVPESSENSNAKQPRQSLISCAIRVGILATLWSLGAPQLYRVIKPIILKVFDDE